MTDSTIAALKHYFLSLPTLLATAINYLTTDSILYVYCILYPQFILFNLPEHKTITIIIIIIRKTAHYRGRKIVDKARKLVLLSTTYEINTIRDIVRLLMGFCGNRNT